MTLRVWPATCAAVLSLAASSVASAQVFHSRAFGAVPNSTGNSAPAFAAEVAAASAYVSAHPGSHATAFIDDGTYVINDTINIPTGVTVSGVRQGGTTVVFDPLVNNEGRTAFCICGPDVSTFSYLAIARADDPAHPALPGGTYEGSSFVYLANRGDVATLRTRGVPGSVSRSFAGLKINLSSGATLSNNGSHESGPDASPAQQLTNDNGINPAQAVLGTVLAVDDSGKVTLAEPNRFDWGRYDHYGETLDQYYNPNHYQVDGSGNVVPAGQCTSGCQWLGKSRFISGPGWVIPADTYVHDAGIDMLVLETNLKRTNGYLAGTYGVYVIGAYDIRFTRTTIRQNVSYYPFLSVRAFHLLFDHDEFDTSAFGALTLDSGSGYIIDHSTFKAAPSGVNAAAGIPPGPNFFIGFDEAPFDVTVQNSTFDTAVANSNGGGVAIGGNGGQYTKLRNNVFTNIPVAVYTGYSEPDHVIFEGNHMRSTSGTMLSGTGGQDGTLSFNTYDNGATVSGQSAAGGGGGAGFDSYNYGITTNYACSNHGMSVQMWFNATTLFPSNTYQNGARITYAGVVQPHAGQPGGTNHTGALNSERIVGVALSPLRAGGVADVTVSLSGPAATDFPFYLATGAGDPLAVSLPPGRLLVPAGQRSVTLRGAVFGRHAGIVGIEAVGLCTATRAVVPTLANVTH